MGVVENLNSVNMKKSAMTMTKTIGKQKWSHGDEVICRMAAEVFEASIVGFYTNSAIVKNKYNDQLYCCSYRNMLDKQTQKALVKTTKSEVLTQSFILRTAYLMTTGEKAKWLKGKQPRLGWKK